MTGARGSACERDTHRPILVHTRMWAHPLRLQFWVCCRDCDELTIGPFYDRNVPVRVLLAIRSVGSMMPFPSHMRPVHGGWDDVPPAVSKSRWWRLWRRGR